MYKIRNKKATDTKEIKSTTETILLRLLLISMSVVFKEYVTRIFKTCNT